MTDSYPVQLDVEYPDRPLNRLTTFFRAFHDHPDSGSTSPATGLRAVRSSYSPSLDQSGFRGPTSGGLMSLMWSPRAPARS